ncbi:glycosyl transferase [Thiocapsa imhoffii]|uniref:Glycosyl transferase n=2 Tax=Thiocapsa imhoffii TaxID=382777 RepID=A0A9X1B9M3_9GAMM|nr:glycosyl transferase [Thiocapsa imhoffii]
MATHTHPSSRPVPRLSIIIPTLNEAGGIATMLTALAPLRTQGCELIVVDGGSDDETVHQAKAYADQAFTAPRGRARQMNAGGAAARGAVLLFLHADTRPPLEVVAALPDRLAQQGHCWGRFDVRIDARHPLLRLVSWSMNQRSRLTGIATGDQAMFVVRETFERVGGYPPLALMEDISLSARLKREGPPLCLREPVVTSARRWERDGVVRTIVFMWSLRLAFALGASPGWLARHYERGQTQ